MAYRSSTEPPTTSSALWPNKQGAAYVTAPNITILAFGGAVLRPGIAHGGHRAARRTGGISRVRPSRVSWSNSWRWANTLSRERKPLRSSMYDCAHSLAEGEPAGRSAVDNNPLLVEGDPAGRFMFYGPAAGAGPIASAEVADILNIAGIRCVGGPQAWLEPFPSHCHQLETLRTCGWRRHVPLQRSVLLHAPRSGCDRQIATIPHRDWNPACASLLPPSLLPQRRRPSPPACGRFEGWLSGQNTEALVPRGKLFKKAGSASISLLSHQDCAPRCSIPSPARTSTQMRIATPNPATLNWKPEQP